MLFIGKDLLETLKISPFQSLTRIVTKIPQAVPCRKVKVDQHFVEVLNKDADILEAREVHVLQVADLNKDIYPCLVNGPWDGRKKRLT